MVKLATLLFISITGLVVLGGHTRVQDPGLNFRKPFEGDITPYGATTALYRIVFSYAGYENAFNVVNEVKVCYLRKDGDVTMEVADHNAESSQDYQKKRLRGPTDCHGVVHSD